MQLWLLFPPLLLCFTDLLLETGGHGLAFVPCCVALGPTASRPC